VPPATYAGSPPPGDFSLGDWLVQTSLNLISRGNTRLQLEPRAIDVLAYLAGRAGRVVSKAELIDAVWQKRFVSEATLTHTIAVLRDALGDDVRAPRYIATVHKRGYRVVAPVQSIAPAAPESLPEGCACWLTVGDRNVPLPEGETVIGRDPGAGVRIDAMGVSRRHARITVRFGRALLDDLGSKNGTFVGRERISGARELKGGEQIAIGPAVLVFRVAGLPGSTRTEVRP
jgi:DNA-binding winged helix-turn-helix (wHTH) protein